MISCDQVANRVRKAGWTLTDQTKRVYLYRKKGTGSAQRLVLPKRDLYPELLVRTILRQAGLTHAEIEAFVEGAIKA